MRLQATREGTRTGEEDGDTPGQGVEKTRGEAGAKGRGNESDTKGASREAAVLQPDDLALELPDVHGACRGAGSQGQGEARAQR